MQSQTVSTAKESHVQTGIVNALQAKLRKFPSFLLRAYRQSTLRLLVLEIRSFPLRILAIVRSSSLRYGSMILAANWDHGIGNIYLENRYSRSCIHHIRELQKDHRWLGPLDEEIAARMYRWGALWALDNLCKETHNTEQIQPSETPQSEAYS